MSNFVVKQVPVLRKHYDAAEVARQDRRSYVSSRSCLISQALMDFFGVSMVSTSFKTAVTIGTETLDWLLDETGREAVTKFDSNYWTYEAEFHPFVITVSRMQP